MPVLNTEDFPRQPHWRKTGTTSTTPVAVFLPPFVRVVKVWVDSLSLVAMGTSPTATSVGATDAVITLSIAGTATGGSAMLNVFGTDFTVNYNDSAATVDTAIEAILGSGTVTSAGGALPGTPITWTFDQQPYKGTPAPHVFVKSNSLTGTGNPRPVITRTTVGVNPYTYLEASTQEIYSISGDSPPNFIYLATVTGTGNYRISGLI